MKIIRYPVFLLVQSFQVILDPLKKSAMMQVLGKSSNRTQLALHLFPEILDEKRLIENLPLGLPIFFSLLNDLTNFPSMEQSLSKQELLLLSARHLIVRQHRSRPSRSCTSNWFHVEALFSMFRYQLLSDTEQILDLLDVRVLVYFQIFSVTRSEMNGCFH